MVPEKAAEQCKGMVNGLAASNSAEEPMVVPENGVRSNSASSTHYEASSVSGGTSQESSLANYYNYYYPGYSASFSQTDSMENSTSTTSQLDQSSIAYYMAGYNPYATGTFVGADGQCVSQAYYTSSGYLQNPVTYGSEALPCYAWDMNYLGGQSDGSRGASEGVKSGPTPMRSNGIKPSQLYGPGIKKLSSSLTSNSRPSVPAGSVSQPKLENQSLRPLNKSPAFANVYRPAGNFQSYSYQKQGLYPNNGYMGYRSNVRMYNGNDKVRSNRRTDSEGSGELSCGPRVHNRSSSVSSEKDPVEPLGFAIEKDKYNLSDFQTEYETAKFYVIKSYSEDDVHKCIKYDVWSSTANGNKKLDAAFHDAEVKATETGSNCPVFLFFSVNGSGQFVGVAEMVGKVDFNKTMDFWQLDKWSGFFPIKWHIIKDVPNGQLRHITLENNENRPVTYTRDTQEVGLKQGLQMLKIFKDYVAKTSLLDDFDFYETREKALLNRSSSKSGAHQEIYRNGDLPKQPEDRAKSGEELSKPQVESVSALVNLTNNLSIDSEFPVQK